MGSPSVASVFAQRVVVGVGDMGVSNNAQMTLSTYALGSCIAVAAYDPAVRVGGLLHLMLPDSNIAPARAAAQPAMFADTGLPLLLRALDGIKANRARLRLFLAGGASVLCNSDVFRIGERNIIATTGYLVSLGYTIRQSSVGGTINRTLHFDLATGAIALKTPAGAENYTLAA